MIKRFALIKNNKVDNIIDCTLEFTYTIVSNYQKIVDISDRPSVSIGDNYNIISDIATTNINLDKFCTVLEFRSKFTDSEKENIYINVARKIHDL